MQLHHVGVVTDDANDLAELYADLLAADVVHRETFRGMRVVFLDTGNGSLELLEPIDDGVIASYLDEHGPGIHHVAFETGNVEAALENALASGIELVDEEPRVGARGHEVAFLHPRSTGGVLIEFVET